mmetsp:Transcript_5481/g.7190  ORF Transcript_5481/g.7190 Transcript_5481/m.7190 type:complete len:221 (+) Transcript_5481:132-794(+)
MISTMLALLLSLLPLTLAADGSEDTCICNLLERPEVLKKKERARWMVHSLNYGVLSTISTRLPDSPPFGNIYSFVDGDCESSSGTPYFYGTYLDQSFKDMEMNPIASFTLTEASLPSVCSGTPLKACTAQSGRGDPEMPVCARLTLTGKLVEVTGSEYDSAKSALLHRHPVMMYWPTDHDWVIAKLEIEDIWFIDYFGGASILDVGEYFDVDLFPSPERL